MSIRHALLGLLAEQPMHGYKLKSAFEERVSPLWRLTTAQIYQSLAALERVGLLESRGERVGRRPARRIFSLTDAGRRELDKWRAAPPHRWARRFCEEIIVRLMLLQRSDAAALLEALAHQERDGTLLLGRLAHSSRGSGNSADIDLPRILADGMAHHLRADLQHLQSCRRALERWAEVHTAALETSLPLDDEL